MEFIDSTLLDILVIIIWCEWLDHIVNLNTGKIIKRWIDYLVVNPLALWSFAGTQRRTCCEKTNEVCFFSQLRGKIIAKAIIFSQLQKRSFCVRGGRSISDFRRKSDIWSKPTLANSNGALRSKFLRSVASIKRGFESVVRRREPAQIGFLYYSIFIQYYLTMSNSEIT